MFNGRRRRPEAPKKGGWAPPFENPRKNTDKYLKFSFCPLVQALKQPSPTKSKKERKEDVPKKAELDPFGYNNWLLGFDGKALSNEV